MAEKVDSGDYTEETKYRRAIALALLKQGFGQHGRAGGLGVAADAVNGLVGGYMLRGADMDEKEANSKVAALLAQQPGFSSGTTAPVVPPSTPGPTNKMPGMSDLIDPADGKPVNAGVVPYASGPPSDFRAPAGAMIGHDSGTNRPGSAFNPYTVRVGEPGTPDGAPIVDRGTGKHAVDYNRNGFGLAYDAPVGSMPSPAVMSQLQKEVEAENFRRGNLTPMPFLGHGEADRLYKTGQDPRRATATSRDLSEASWRPQATALHDRSQIGVSPSGSDIRFNYNPATGANNINEFPVPGGPPAPIRVADATGATGSLPMSQRGITAAAGLQPAGAQTAQALPTPQPTPQQPPASQPGAQTGPSAEQVGYYQKLVAEAQRTGNPKITQMAMQYRAQVEAQLQKSGTDDLKEYEFAKRQGETDTFTQWHRKNKASTAANTNVNVDQRQESAFATKMAGKQADRFDALIESGLNAKQFTGYLMTLADLRKNYTPGLEAVIKSQIGPIAEAMGVKVDGLSSIQATEAIIARMAPQMRVPGSGATSDFEARQFIKALPGLMNNAEGQQLVSQTLQSVEEAKIAASEIASRAAAGEISPREAEKELRALPSPYQLFRERYGKSPGDATDAGAGKFSNPNVAPGGAAGGAPPPPPGAAGGAPPPPPGAPSGAGEWVDMGNGFKKWKAK